MYESPIEIIVGEMTTEWENGILKAVQNYNVDCNKEELIRALAYDRDQYQKGFEDGRPKWIPYSERLPEDDGEYLVWIQWDIEEEPSYSIVNYDANAEAFGEWHEYFDPDTLGSLGSDFRSFKGVFAWMPMPEPYEGGEE